MKLSSFYSLYDLAFFLNDVKYNLRKSKLIYRIKSKIIYARFKIVC